MKKIGQILIEKGLLTSGNLHSALQTQLIRGGSLGTSLIELGFIDEAALGRTLAEIYGVSYAPREMFESIPPAIIGAVPEEIVRKLRVVPIGREGRALHLALIDPRCRDGLSSATGCRIVPYVAPEIRILEAAERYYGIPRRMRYVNVSRDVAAAAESAGPRQKARRRVSPQPIREVEPRRPSRALDLVFGKLSKVETHGQLGEVILDHLSGVAQRCILFDVSGERAVVANWKGIDLEPSKVRSLEISVNPDSLFALIAESDYYQGAVPPGLGDRSFYGRLGLDVPREIVILPIYGDERLEAVVYGDGGRDGSIREAPGAYDPLLEKISLAMKMIAIKTHLTVGSAHGRGTSRRA